MATTSLILLAMLVALLFFVLASCSTPLSAPELPVTSVAMNKAATSLTTGQTEQLTVILTPENARKLGMTWLSSDPAVASVSANGLITAVAAGQATITATTDDGSFSTTCTVTCTPPVIGVTGLSLDRTALNLSAGQTSQLVATIAPANATTQAVTWSSDNESLATVSSTGLVMARAAGSTTINATSLDGAFKASCALTIAAAAVPVSGISLNKDSTVMTAGSSEQLVATLTPANATSKAVSWSSGSPSVASVSASGLVSALAAGTAILTVTSIDGAYKASCVVTVTVPVTSVTLNKSSASLIRGMNEQLSASVNPFAASNKSVVWTSSNPAVASVSATGLVNAVAAGSATITVTTLDGGKTATCAYTVLDVTTANAAIAAGLTAAQGSTDSSSAAYYLLAADFSKVTLYLKNFVSNGYVLTGSMVSTIAAPQIQTGSATLSGGQVTQVTCNVNNTAATGTIVYQFTNGTSWTFNVATQLYSQN